MPKRAIAIVARVRHTESSSRDDGLKKKGAPLPMACISVSRFAFHALRESPGQEICDKKRSSIVFCPG